MFKCGASRSICRVRDPEMQQSGVTCGWTRNADSGRNMASGAEFGMPTPTQAVVPPMEQWFHAHTEAQVLLGQGSEVVSRH